MVCQCLARISIDLNFFCAIFKFREAQRSKERRRIYSYLLEIILCLII